MSDFVAAYNFARRLKILRGLTPYEYICTIWTQEPGSFTLDPTHQIPGLNIAASLSVVIFEVMRSRTVLAALLAVVLLTMSSAASVCEITCSLRAAGSRCDHSPSIHSPSHHPDGMTDCGMTSMARLDVNANSCLHSVCEQQAQALVSEKNTGEVRLLSFPQTVISATLTLQPIEWSFACVSETPPVRSSFLVILQTTIRV